MNSSPTRVAAVFRDAGEEEIGAADGGGDVRVGAAAERHESREVGVLGGEEVA